MSSVVDITVAVWIFYIQIIILHDLKVSLKKKKTQHKETSLLFETFSFIVLEPFVVLNLAV